MATSLKESEKEVRFDKTHTYTFHLVKKIVKIGLVGPEIIWLKLKKKKLWKIKCIALLASLPSGQNYMTHSEVHFNSYFTVSTLFLRI